jgi:hypothetical protein
MPLIDGAGPAAEQSSGGRGLVDCHLVLSQLVRQSQYVPAAQSD